MPKALRTKHSRAVRWFHWVNFPVLLVMIWSGLLIYGANRVYRIGIGEWTLFAFDTAFAERLNLRFRLAEGMAWHFSFAWLFALNGLSYLLYLIFSKEWKKIVPGRGALKGAWEVFLEDLRFRRHAASTEGYNPAQRIAYSGVILLGAGATLSGLAIYKPVQLSWLTALFGGYQSARWIHFWITGLFVLFIVVHILQVLRSGWNSFRAMITGKEVIETSE